MVSYSFYTDVYMGCLLGEKEFSPLAARAAAVLARYERIYRVQCDGADSRAMALCAMAETLKRYEKRSGITSTSIGGVSVQYEESSRRELARELFSQASIYLDITRGVEG